MNIDKILNASVIHCLDNDAKELKDILQRNGLDWKHVTRFLLERKGDWT